MKHHSQSTLQEEEFIWGLQFWGRRAHCDGEAWWEAAAWAAGTGIEELTS